LNFRLCSILKYPRTRNDLLQELSVGEDRLVDLVEFFDVSKAGKKISVLERTQKCMKGGQAHRIRAVFLKSGDDIRKLVIRCLLVVVDLFALVVFNVAPE